jgi:hypothetical protein
MIAENEAGSEETGKARNPCKRWPQLGKKVLPWNERGAGWDRSQDAAPGRTVERQGFHTLTKVIGDFFGQLLVFRQVLATGETRRQVLLDLLVVYGGESSIQILEQLFLEILAVHRLIIFSVP